MHRAWFVPDPQSLLPKLWLLSPWDGTVWWGLFTSGGEALPGGLLVEVPPTCSSQGLQEKPVMSFPLGMMPSDEGGSETESLYEIEGMNKWILFL